MAPGTRLVYPLLPDPAKPDSGSWCYRLLPYLEQEALFRNAATVPPGGNMWDNWMVPVKVFIEPGRGRPGVVTLMTQQYGGQTAPYRVTNGVPHQGTSTDYALNIFINYPWSTRQNSNERIDQIHNDASWRGNRRPRVETIADGNSNTLFVGGKHIRTDQISGSFANRDGNWDECIYMGGWGGTARSFTQSISDRDPEAKGNDLPSISHRGWWGRAVH